jgi:dipeptidyl aminopeptidase/acylaminoacyl peptidase
VFDPSAYRCAISLAGPSDLHRMLARIGSGSGGYAAGVLRYWDRFMGAKSPNDPELNDISPALHADKAAMPILLIHGQDDTVVPYEQSVVMEAALKRAGKPVEFVTLKSEDHWLSRSETRLQMLTAAMAFLAKNNPPDPATATAKAVTGR